MALEHLSFSSVNSLMYCGKQYELEKVKKVPQTPAWFLIGGSAFHAASDQMDGDYVGTHGDLWEQCFEEEIDKRELESLMSRGCFRAAGKTKDRPAGQDEEYWWDLGPKLIDMYADHMRTMDKPDMIEESLLEQFDFSNLPFRGYVDRVYPNLIVDTKTGTSTPKNGMQLGFYRAGLLMKYGEAPDYGAYYKARDGKLSKTIPLHKYTPEYVGRILDQARRAIEAEVFIPNESFSCNSCSVRAGCYTVGGADSAKYDTLDPNYNGGSDA